MTSSTAEPGLESHSPVKGSREVAASGPRRGRSVDGAPDRSQAGTPGPVHPLLQRSPEFLCLIDSNPDRAKLLLWQFVVAFFRATPPRFYRRFAESEREDLVSEFYLTLVDRDFRKLRQYRELSAGFGAWLNRVASNWLASILRARQPQPIVESITPIDDEHAPIDLMDSRPGPADDLGHKQVYDAVMKTLRALEAMCQYLILAVADGMKPREMVVALGRPPEDNVRIAEKHRYCLAKLKRLVEGEGVDVTPYLRRKPK